MLGGGGGGGGVYHLCEKVGLGVQLGGVSSSGLEYIIATFNLLRAKAVNL